MTAKPVVTQQPVDAFVQEAHEATFTSTASGAPAPTVQWQESTDGGATYKKSPATGNTLKLNNVSKTMDGWKFRAVFTNSDGQRDERSRDAAHHQRPAHPDPAARKNGARRTAG